MGKRVLKIPLLKGLCLLKFAVSFGGTGKRNKTPHLGVRLRSQTQKVNLWDIYDVTCIQGPQMDAMMNCRTHLGMKMGKCMVTPLRNLNLKIGLTSP